MTTSHHQSDFVLMATVRGPGAQRRMGLHGVVVCCCALFFLFHGTQSLRSFSRAPLTADAVFGHADWITEDGDLRTLPFMLEGGMDGFYAARLKRT